MKNINKEDFLEFIFANRALQFGDFLLKSGRRSPYFFNAGVLQTGRLISRLGGFYADYIKKNNLLPEVLFGPAYKGIPIALATCCALATDGYDVAYCFDRKEKKQHGEGGEFVGSLPSSDMLLLDDVITAGTAVSHILTKLKQQKIQPRAILVAVNRQEKNNQGIVATQAIYENFGVQVHSLISMDDVIAYGVAKKHFSDDQLINVEKYLASSHHAK